jgi:hypothetical protein
MLAGTVISARCAAMTDAGSAGVKPPRTAGKTQTFALSPAMIKENGVIDRICNLLYSLGEFFQDDARASGGNAADGKRLRQM